MQRELELQLVRLSPTSNGRVGETKHRGRQCPRGHLSKRERGCLVPGTDGSGRIYPKLLRVAAEEAEWRRRVVIVIGRLEPFFLASYRVTSTFSRFWIDHQVGFGSVNVGSGLKARRETETAAENHAYSRRRPPVHREKPDRDKMAAPWLVPLCRWRLRCNRSYRIRAPWCDCRVVNSRDMKRHDSEVRRRWEFLTGCHREYWPAFIPTSGRWLTGHVFKFRNSSVTVECRKYNPATRH